MASATTPCVSSLRKNLSDEERRWVVIGICLNKVLTPALRKVLSVEIPKWHQTLLRPPTEIDKQTPGKHEKNLPPSTMKLNYDSINNNAVHKSPKLYDYAVKDPLSLAKLFMKPFMASFTGFDHTMDTSAALSVMCEAQPFVSSVAAGFAKKVRSDIRNEWAHCDFTHWTEPNLRNAFHYIESLVNNVNLTTADRKIVLDCIENWKNNGTKLCLDNEVDWGLLDLIRTEVTNLQDSITSFNEDSQTKKKLLDYLQTVQTSLSKEIRDLRENVDRLQNQYITTVQDVERIKTEVSKIATKGDEIPYVFHAPRKNPWFAGRLTEIQDLTTLLEINDDTPTKPCKVSIAAVSGLGGVGKTTLATEYANQKKNFYTGGVYWLSDEDDTTFENSVYDAAMGFGTFERSDSFGVTFSSTLATISRNKNPWLIVLDNMDQLDLSTNIVKLISGPWQHGASGHILITTRRKPTALANDIRHFDERCCLNLKCFEKEEGKKFLFHRVGIVQNEESELVAEKLVQQLGGLPLALEQAGAYIKSLPCTLSEYLELYNSQRLRLLNRQKSTPASTYDSAERLAVRTTWHLNFEHIKQTVDDGKAATTFLHACAFLNPNEIQKDLINIGEPPVDDVEFSECVKTPLGCQQILKLLTDFSLFKESHHSNLSVHHLVQEVIRDNLNPEKKIQVMIHAIRMLRHVFLNCASPEELLSALPSERQVRPSVASSDPSRFYKWHKLCLHSYDLVKHLKMVVKQSDVYSTKILLPETARIVYECAIHLSANSKHDEAKEVTNFAYSILNLSNQQVPMEQSHSLSPHVIPLPELVCRQILYSCNTPATSQQDGCKISTGKPSHTVTTENVKVIRMKGNDSFKKGLYNDAMKLYSDAINMSKNTTVFDATLLSNRASAYLKLEKYDEALHDADEYILQCPKCWKGYARKALALIELKDVHGACVAVSLAYYYERNIFSNFEPFKKKFDSFHEMRLSVCRNNSDLSKALWKAKCISNVDMFSALLGNVTENDQLPVVILEPGNYLISLHTIDTGLFQGETILPIDDIIFVGIEGECSLTFDDNLSVHFCKIFIAYNISFHSRSTNCHFEPGSEVKLSHCSFESTNKNHTSFCCKGKLKVNFCKFCNCSTGGLIVVGDAEVKDSEFFANGNAGLEVREGGSLVVRKSKMYANKQGLLIGPQVKECVVEDCDLYDNEWGGIVVHNSTSGVTIKRNRIYDNDETGIAVLTTSRNVYIFENELSKNSHFGIAIHPFTQAVIKKNIIRENLYGGVCVEAIFSAQQSVIEYNDISDNFGPGIHEEGNARLASRKGNKIENNKETRTQATAQSEAKLCYHCRTPEKNLKKCNQCFTAEYCGRDCQKKHWKFHKKACDRLLLNGSVLLNYEQKPMMGRHLPGNKGTTISSSGRRGAGLLPVGPRYCPPPNTMTRFIVKMAAGITQGKELDPSVVRLYDRSLKMGFSLVLIKFTTLFGSMVQWANCSMIGKSCSCGSKARKGVNFAFLSTSFLSINTGDCYIDEHGDV